MIEAILGFAVGTFFGWLYAHQHIAAECDKLGGFYVGRKIYKCTSTDSNDGSSNG